MNDLTDKFFLYLESLFFKGRLPIKYQGVYIIENIWVIHYSCLSVNPLNVDEAIKKCIHIRYSALHNKFVQLDANDEDFKYRELFGSTLKAFVSLDAILSNQTIFFSHFKLQDYSEYKRERRNSIINNLIN